VVFSTIGAPLLRRTRVILDYACERAIFEPSEQFTAPFAYHDASGLYLTGCGSDFRQFQVVYVVTGSLAAEAGLRVDDQITALDGRLATELTLDMLRRELSPKGERQSLDIGRDGVALTMELALRRLL
jgi:C-terminal processing protease CtpA/Prc